ncbi:MAG: ATP-binding cassette domain-containing protein [Candidatus Bathyarchaeia archaeon]|nr:ATP-binding cassette domain-containing protein [Candidatus Bathyarchaeota archaeon]
MGNLLITLELKKYFPIRGGLLGRKKGEVKAVDGVSLAIKKGETFGLVGESGCGKTTYGKTIIRLLNPDGGKILFDPKGELPDDIQDDAVDEFNIADLKGKQLKALRRHMQIVYQNPSTSLNPRMLVKDIVSEPLIVHGVCKGKEAEERVLDMLKHVGLSEEHMRRYPHEFSGGQRQRIAIARALITKPEFVVLDEPTSSVDVSVRASLINLFKKLQEEMNLTYVFISHDLSVVEAFCDRVAVMYLGKVVELATAKELFNAPLHPYTQALFSAIPIPDPETKRMRIILKGEPPSPANPPKGCRFHPRCIHATDVCSKEEPSLKMVRSDHFVACHLY